MDWKPLDSMKFQLEYSQDFFLISQHSDFKINIKIQRTFNKQYYF